MCIPCTRPPLKCGDADYDLPPLSWQRSCQLEVLTGALMRPAGNSVQCSVAVPQHLPLAVQRCVPKVLRLMPLDGRVCCEQRLADSLMEPVDQICSAKCAHHGKHECSKLLLVIATTAGQRQVILHAICHCGLHTSVIEQRVDRHAQAYWQPSDAILHMHLTQIIRIRPGTEGVTRQSA